MNRDYFPIVTFVILAFSLLEKGANAFPELRDKTKAAEFLAIPGTALEKVMARYIIYSFGIILFVGLTAALFTIALSCFVSIREIFSIKYEHPIWILFFILMLQSVFFVGGLYFKTLSGLKTFLCFLLYYFLIMGAVSFLFNGHFIGWRNYVGVQDSIGAALFDIISGVLVYVICMLTVFFKVKEVELNEI